MDLIASVLIVVALTSACLGLQCHRCRNIVHSSNDENVRNLLQPYSNPNCNKYNFNPSSSGVTPITCSTPTNGMEARCGYTSGRASASHTYTRYNGGQQQTNTASIQMDVTIMDCMYVARNTPNGCKGQNGVQILENELKHMQNSVTFLRNTQIINYNGDLCFCNYERCSDFNTGKRGVASVVVLFACALIARLV